MSSVSFFLFALDNQHVVADFDIDLILRHAGEFNRGFVRRIGHGQIHMGDQHIGSIVGGRGAMPENALHGEKNPPKKSPKSLSISLWS